MTRILFTGDLHLTDRPQDEYRWEIFRWLTRQAHKRVVKDICILGDITDRKDRHSAVLVNRLCNELLQLSKVADIHIIKGNHDYTDPKEPFFDFLSYVGYRHPGMMALPVITYYSDPTQVKIGGRLVQMLPHSGNWQEEWAGLDTSKCEMILMHQPVKGAVGANGFGIEGLPPDYFGDYKGRILAGDVHVPQKVGPITYVGSPYPIAFGDEFQPRVLYFEAGKFKSIKRKTIAKRVVDLSLEDDMEDAGLEEGDHVRFRLHLPPSELVNWNEHKRWVLDKAESLGLKVFGIELQRVQKRKRLSTTPKPKAARKPMDILQAFVEARDVDGTIVKYGQSVVETLS